MATKRNWNQCRKKKRYRDEHTVNIYRKKFEEARGTKLDYYWCAYCNGYHLTSEEFRLEGYGIMVDSETMEYIPMLKPSNVEDRNYYLGKKNRIHMSISEFEGLLYAQSCMA